MTRVVLVVQGVVISGELPEGMTPETALGSGDTLKLGKAYLSGVHSAELIVQISAVSAIGAVGAQEEEKVGKSAAEIARELANPRRKRSQE